MSERGELDIEALAVTTAPASELEYASLAHDLANERLRAAGQHQRLREIACLVVRNAYGTKPRHAYTADGHHADDCIPCELINLAEAVDDHDTHGWLVEQRNRADLRRR